MRVFVYYVIFTKSEPLGTFKYYLLNQAVWSHAFELIMVLGNPVVLSPYTAGFMGGIFQSIATYSTAVFLVAVGFIIFTNNIVATILSLLNRYIFMFYPGSRRYLENKCTFGTIIVFLSTIYGLIITSVARSKRDYSVVRQYAIDEGNMALQEFFYEPSFLYVRDKGTNIRSPFLAFLILLTLRYLGGRRPAFKGQRQQQGRAVTTEI
uniref:7TM_GPCR_Srx domain-containing protein n=1 Tax=Panagrellus redivivus TaxID=6233 RepID=A0A7E4WE37_PANRE